MSVVKSIRAYFLDRALGIHTEESTADCGFDVILAFQLDLPGVKEISENEVMSGDGGRFQSIMTVNCGVEQIHFRKGGCGKGCQDAYGRVSR